MSIIPLRIATFCEDEFPDFKIERLKASVLFDTNSEVQDSSTIFDGAIVETGAPFAVLPYAFHSTGKIRIYQDFGLQPFRVIRVCRPA